MGKEKWRPEAGNRRTEEKEEKEEREEKITEIIVKFEDSNV
jgi:hypothetical protein